MNIQVLGAHNCERQNSKLISLLIDDVLAMDAGALTSSLSLEAQLKLKALLLTHQHYDHIRDIPALAMNLFLSGATTKIYSIPAVYDILTKHLLIDQLYPNFLQKPSHNPTLKFNIIEPHKAEPIEGYTVLAVPVNHSVPAVGYQVSSADGQVLLYIGDTGPGLTDCWRRVSPQLIIIEVTAPDKYAEWAAKSGHLTPRLLEQELQSFREVNGYIPRVLVVHMNPSLEEEIAIEIATVAQELGSSITLGYEGMQISL
jgi:ribonuclease BN (tRNA processing enzyme)